jgi:acyl-CoA thioesterase-2
MPAVPPPEQLSGPFDMTAEQRATLSASAQRFLNTEMPFEFRSVDPMDPFHPSPREPRQAIWFRAVDRLPDDPQLHRCLLAYASDYHLVATALRPHGLSFVSPGVIIASIDHAMWFHRPARVDDWLLYSMESPSTAGSRGFARADIFTRDGLLVASTAQEGLVRLAPTR